MYPSREALEAVLKSGKRLRVYCGVDPTGATLHIGHLAWLQKLRQFQELGHEVIMLVGDFTGMIGDPTRKAKLFALAAENGDLLWEFESDNYILQSPFLQGDTVYVAGSFSDSRDIDEGGHMRLYALNAADGSVRWQYESDDGFTKQVYATDQVVAYVAYQDFAVGVDAATGELRWRRDTGNWVPTFMGKGNTVYFGSANTTVHALNMDSGDAVWTYNIPEGTFNYVLGAPVIAADQLVFLTQWGEIISLDASTGELRWQFPTGIVGARTGLSVSGGWLFIGDAEGVVHGFTDK